jgi:hypothetical protein
MSPVLQQTAEDIAKLPPGSRNPGDILSLLPFSQSGSFAQFVQASRATLPTLAATLASVDAQRLNKMLTNAPGASGTALLSRVAAPATLAAAVEYGSILQERTDTATTLRANALGVARMLFGTEQYQYCPEIAQANCSSRARVFRRLSASVSFETTKDSKPADAPGVEALLGNDYRVASWGARFDLTPTNNLDDPSYVKAWGTAIEALQKDPASKALVESVVQLFRPFIVNDDSVYSQWSAETVVALQAAPAAEFAELLERRVKSLLARLEAEEPEFAARASSMVRAYERYYDVRDTLLRAAQSHKSSFEFVNHRPGELPHYSDFRYIYSHQPPKSAAVMTFNAAASLYDQTPADSSRWRDLQFAGQVDRRLGNPSDARGMILTVGAYYQWMIDDALISIEDTSTLPGTTIPLPEKAVPLLKTKGHIAAAQAKLIFKLGEAVKVPLSVTWASRKELIDESEVRGQIGFSFDLDQLLH